MKTLITGFLVCLSIGALVVAKGKDTPPTSIHLTPTNHVTLSGPISPESVREASLKLHRLPSQGMPLYLVLNSPGGDIRAGIEFLESIKSIKNLHTITINGASMASNIAQSIPGKRYVTESSSMMFHRAAGGIQGAFESGELENRLAYWKSIVLSIEKKNASRIGISIEKYKANVLSEWWIYGKDLISQGVADEIITISCSKELLDGTHKETIMTFFGPVESVVSNCPIIP